MIDPPIEWIEMLHILITRRIACAARAYVEPTGTCASLHPIWGSISVQFHNLPQSRSWHGEFPRKCEEMSFYGGGTHAIKLRTKVLDLAAELEDIRRAKLFL